MFLVNDNAPSLRYALIRQGCCPSACVLCYGTSSCANNCCNIMLNRNILVLEDISILVSVDSQIQIQTCITLSGLVGMSCCRGSRRKWRREGGGGVCAMVRGQCGCSFHGGETTSCARGDCIGTGCTNVIRWVTVWRAGVRGIAVVAPAIARRPVCCVQRGGAVWVAGGGAVVLLCGRCGGGGGVCHV